jgi:PAS domain S-box-containing protein
MQDLTDRKRAEEERERLLIAVREEKDRLSALINSIQDEVWFADTEENFTLANPSALREFGLNGSTDVDARELARGLEVYRPDGTPRPVEEAPPLRALQGEVVMNQEETIRTPRTGELRVRQVSATPVKDARGHIIGSVSVVRDITEPKRAEEAMRRSEARFRSIFTSNVAAMAIWDSEGRLLDSNDQFLKLLGYTRKEFEGGQVRWDEATPPEMRQRDYDAVKEIQAGRDIEPYEKEFVRPDRTRVPVIIGGRILPGEQNIGIAFAVEITDRKQAEKALQHRTLELQHLTETLEQRVKERTAELANLSAQLVSAQENERRRVSYDLHDNVWQMLVAIRFAIDNLFSSQEDWRALRNKSKQVTTDIVDLVGKIRSMQGDLWPYVLDDIGLGATIDWYCREFRKNHSGLVIEMKNEITEREIPSSAKIVIYRILQETLSNVAKHSQATRVTLRFMKRDHGMEFTVEDNGIGFDPEETIAKRAPWGGLGLLSIKARTELSGGILGIESVKGSGTTIRASWPA